MFGRCAKNAFDEKGQTIFSNDILTIDSTLKVEVTAETIQVIKKKNDSCDNALLNDETFKDFSIVVGDEQIQAHKCILAIASPVFSAMLEEHTKESKEGKVTIDDFDHDTVKAGVQFMYRRKLIEKLTMENLLNLYRFADKYQLIDTVSIPLNSTRSLIEISGINIRRLGNQT
uniref:BTB domain-containing protein n=1 Tax=Panagrolaimus sp. JU765 TaxID=591449 RepID=A0AC34QAX0_9BILA